MSKDKLESILSPGQPSIQKRYNEETTRMTFTLPKSFREYLATHGISSAEYLRRLIASDMDAQTKEPPKGES
jgi:hypothetical protein